MKIKPTDISKTDSASSIIFNSLRLAIIKGELTDGTPLRQEEIGRMFNASRIPVREALLRLEELGLVKTQRYKGAVVAGISEEEVDELFDLRNILECAMLRKAVPKLTDETLEKARRYCDMFATSNSPEEWGELNRKFHCSLLEAARLPFHMNMLDTLLDRINRFLLIQLVLTDGTGTDTAIQEHERILEACKENNVEEVERLNKEHVEAAKKSVITCLQQKRERN